MCTFVDIHPRYIYKAEQKRSLWQLDIEFVSSYIENVGLDFAAMKQCAELCDSHEWDALADAQHKQLASTCFGLKQVALDHPWVQ